MGCLGDTITPVMVIDRIIYLSTPDFVKKSGVFSSIVKTRVGKGGINVGDALLRRLFADIKLG